MTKPASLIIIFLLVFAGRAQEISLPADLRQHALTQYNASLFNPTFALDRNNPQSLSFWTRWQWQQIDTDPTTLFLNYTRNLNEKSAAGIGFFQHNTGIYFNTGGVVNYAYSIKLNPIIKLSVGANLFGFNQSLADTRFVPDPDVLPFPIDVTDDFILQLAPGFNLMVENFSLSLASENLFDYNLTDKASNTETSDKIFMGMASYDFPVMKKDSTAFLRPSIYLRTIPEQENQIGMNVLFSTQKYWAQTGYNNFYGISIGAGGTVFNRFSLGALIEFGTNSSLNTKDSSFELIASFFLGKPENRRQAVVNVFDALDQNVAVLDEEGETENEKEELEEEQTTEPEVEEVSEDVTPEQELPTIDKKEERRLAAEEKALAKERRKDSIATAKKEKEALALAEKQEKENEKVKAEQVNKLEAAAEKARQEAAIAAAEEAQKAEAAAEELKKAEALAAAERMRTQKRQDSIKAVREAAALAQVEKMKQQRELDSISKAKKAAAIAEAQKLQEQRQQDSIARVKGAELEAEKKAEEAVAQAEEPEVVKPQAGEKYEEVQTEDGLEPGYYLIANVFGTKKYFDAFMRDLDSKGIQAGSFLRSKNNYNYAYLQRYNTISEARRARDSKFDGKYQGKTWIFRVVGK